MTPLSSTLMPTQGSLTHFQQNLNQDALVVIDAGVVGISSLILDLSASTADVLVLSADQDGIRQITNVLEARSHLSSLHIVSHGTPGCLHLGNTQLSFATLSQHADDLSIWASRLRGKDILLYGCQVAKGALGHLFIQQLHQLTNANIAASEKRVGRIGRHTNWTLEAQLGEVQTPLIFSAALQASYPGHFEPVVDFSISTNTAIESEGTPVTFNFRLSEPPPSGGTVVRFEGNAPQVINQLDVFGISVDGLAGIPEDISPGQDFSAFSITILQQNASFTLPAFNDFIDEDPLEIVWTVSPISGGTVGNSSAVLTLYDNPSQVPSPMPEINLTSNLTTLIEDEGTEVTFTLSLSEPPPEGGLRVDIATGKAFSLGDFDVFPPGPQATTTGSRLVRGFPDNSGFTLNVTEQTATVTLPIFDDEDRPASDPNATRNDDIGEEQTTFSVAAGEGYTVGGNSSITLTLKDTNQVVAPDPLVVGLSATPTDLVEEAGTLTTLTFTLSEAPPEGGVNVTIDSDIPASLAEFNVGAANFNGAQLVGANDDSSGFTVNITQQTATIALPVFDDDLDEGLEELTYSLQASDDYEIDGAASSITLSITDDDQVVTPPVNTAPVADNDSYSTAFGTPLTVAADNGVLVGDTDADGDSLVATFVSNPSNGSVDFEEDGSFVYTPNAGFSGSDSFTYQASDGEDNSAVTTVTVEVGEDTTTPVTPVVSFSTTPGLVSEAEGTGLVMNFAVDGDIPPEGITVKLEGNAARIMQQFTAAQTRFDAETGEIFYRFDKGLVADNVVGGELELFSLEDGDASESSANPAAAGDAFLSNFTFKITEASASITLPVFDDIVEEDDATFTYTLVAGEGYSVDSAASTGTFTVTDGVAGGVGPTVGVTATPTTLVESDQTVATITFNTVGDIPAEGLVVQLAGSARAIAEFDVNATNPRLSENETVVEGVVVEGGSIVGTDNVAGSVFFRITDPTATITVPVFQDDVIEGTEELTFNLLDGETYEVDAEASAISLSIEDSDTEFVPDIVGTDEGETLVGDENNNIIDALAGDDTVAGGLGDDVILGGDGDDVLRGDANSRNPQNGAGGNDIIFGGNGNDRIGGKAGNDILSGDAGNDLIWGDAGDDIIMGGTGNDILVGDNFSSGGGNDLFVFGTGDGTDTILDFQVGSDRIGLVQGELAFEDLTLTQDGSNTLLGVTSSGETLAILNGVQASSLTESSFTVVADVSNLEDALALI